MTAVERPTIDDELDLLEQAHTIVRAHLRRIPMAHQYDDMLSDALWGAAVACTRWDPEGGSSLLSYAWNRMNGAVIDGLRDRSPVSRHHYRNGVREADLPPQRRNPMSLSLWTHPENDRPAPRHPPATDAAAFDAVDNRLLVEQLLAKLPAQERYVVQHVDLDGQLQQDVAAALGITPSRVCQVLHAAHKRLRQTHNPNQPASITL